MSWFGSGRFGRRESRSSTAPRFACQRYSTAMMKQPSIDARWTRSFATALKWLGFAAMGFGAALLVLLTASPLGLLRAYPAPPEAAVDDPLGLDRKITDLQSLDRNAGEPMEAYLRRLPTSLAGGLRHYVSMCDTW